MSGEREADLGAGARAMRILDQQRYWAFIKAYFICFTALVGLYVVIDAFANIDEFSEVATGAELFKVMGRYYLVHMSSYYNQLCGVISMMAAIFTVTWMQKNNELLAMLSAGISTQRVIRPVLISAVIVSALAVANQEFIIPAVAEELQKPPDDDGNRKLKVSSKQDSNDLMIHGAYAYRAQRTIIPFNLIFLEDRFGAQLTVFASQGTYIPENDRRCPHKGGWILRNVQFTPPDAPLTEQMRKVFVEITADQLAKYPRPMIPPIDEGPKGAKIEPVPITPGPTYFLRTDATFTAVSRNAQWYQYASTYDLTRALNDPISASQKVEIAVFLHGRMVRPFMSLCLMIVSLPLVLGGEGRNMFINLGLSLAASGVFYGLTFMCQYLGANYVLSPEMSAWLPLFIFATVGVARWDRIRT
jgi:lipopolysaccharide export system permease protein